MISYLYKQDTRYLYTDVLKTFCKLSMLLIIKSKNMEEYSNRKSSIDPKMNERVITAKF